MDRLESVDGRKNGRQDGRTGVPDDSESKPKEQLNRSNVKDSIKKKWLHHRDYIADADEREECHLMVLGSSESNSITSSMWRELDAIEYLRSHNVPINPPPAHSG